MITITMFKIFIAVINNIDINYTIIRGYVYYNFLYTNYIILVIIVEIIKIISIF